MGIEKYLYKPYESIYKSLFEKEESRLRNELSSDVNIDHIGSSSVPNLGGKGLIDIYITSQESKLKEIALILQEKLNYNLKEDNSDKERLFFLRHQTDNNGVERTYHLHLSNENNQNYKETISFRDFLISHPKEAKKYADIKKEASNKAVKSSSYQETKKIYQQTKKPIIEEMIKKSLVWKNKNNRM